MPALKVAEGSAALPGFISVSVTKWFVFRRATCISLAAVSSLRPTSIPALSLQIVIINLLTFPISGG